MNYLNKVVFYKTKHSNLELKKKRKREIGEPREFLGGLN